MKMNCQTQICAESRFTCHHARKIFQIGSIKSLNVKIRTSGSYEIELRELRILYQDFGLDFIY